MSGFKRQGVLKRGNGASVTRVQGTIALDAATLALSGTAGSSTASGSVGYSNSGGGSLAGLHIGTVTYTNGSGWLSAAVFGSSIQITANPAALSAGTFVGQVPVTDANATNSPQSIEVTFTVAAASQSSVLVLSQTTAEYDGVSSTSGTPVTRTITVSNGGGGVLPTPVIGTPTETWCGASYAAGVITVSMDGFGQSNGLHTATFTVTCAGASASPQTVQVRMTVFSSSTTNLICSPSSLVFAAVEGGADPAPQNISVVNTGSGTLAGPACAEAGSAAWLTEPRSGTGNNYTFAVTPATGALTPGTYTETLTITDANTAQTGTIEVFFTVSAVSLPGNYPAPQFDLPSWVTHNVVTDAIDGTLLTEPADSYFTGTTHVCTSLAQLNTAFANAVDTDIIQVSAGLTISGGANMVAIPTRADPSGWVKVRTSGYASLPAVGTRIHGTNDLANLATLALTGVNSFVVRFAQGSRGWKFQGLKFTMAAGTTAGYESRILMDTSPTTQTTAAHCAKDLIFQHCVFENPPSSYCQRGLAITSQYTIVRDCWFSGFFNVSSDTQAISINSTPGFILIENNLLSGKAENILAGGSTGKIGSAGICGDIVIRRNYLYKDPAWLPNTTGGQCKNFFELKVGRRIVFEGNVCENHNGQGQQSDIAMTAKPQAAGETSWCYVKDILIRYNTFANSSGPLNVSNVASGAGVYTPDGTQRIEAAHNLWLSTYPAFVSNSSNCILSVGNGSPNISMHHNVIRCSNSVLKLANVTNTMPGMNISDNINVLAPGNGPIYRTGGQTNNTALDSVCGSGQWTARTNLSVTRTWGATLLAAPWSNKNPASLAAIGFTNSAGGDYSLTAASVYKGIGTGGSDPGVNMSRIYALTTGVGVL